MPTAIIGYGNIGARLARDLVRGGERVIIAGGNDAQARSLAQSLGAFATASPVDAAIDAADAIVLAVWLDVIKQLLATYGSKLSGKVVIDPSNPIAPDDKGGFVKTIPQDQSAGSIVASLLPKGAHYAKAFGTIAAEELEGCSRQTPPVALFFATDDASAQAATERLIKAAGFEPVKVGGVESAIRIEVFGDLHPFGGLNGKTLDAQEARALLGAASARS